jgi:DNA-binding XRE family transcriptional regulator
LPLQASITSDKIQCYKNIVIRYNLYYYETMKRIDIPHAAIKLKLKLIKDNVRRIRENRNYSQEYMAGKLSVSQNTYSKLELGYTALTLERLISIAHVLDVDIIGLVYPTTNTDKQKQEETLQQALL